VAVFEFELGDEPAYEDLTLVSDSRFPGLDQQGLRVGDVMPGPVTEPVAPPLKGRVRVGGPHGFKITTDRVAGDEGLGRFIDQNFGRSEFYFVHLSISFATHDGPLLEAAQVNLALTGGPEPPTPFALSMRPDADGTAETVGRTVTIGPKLTLPVVGAVEAGSFSDQRSYQKASLFVRGLGLDGSTPGWEFTRTDGKRLEGSCRLELIVQTGHGTTLSVSGMVTAQARIGFLPFRFRTELPLPLTFATRI
jgi:hypothetical protein